MTCLSSAPRTRKVGRVQWRPPDVSWIKVNIDGAFIPDYQNAGGGRVVRDHNGEILAAFAATLEAGSGLEAEVLAVLKGLILAKQYGDHIWIESDSETVVRWISTGQLGAAVVCHSLARIRGELRGVSWRMTHIFREGNKVAELLAKNGSKATTSVVFSRDSTPSLVKALCRLDQLGLPNFRF